MLVSADIGLGIGTDNAGERYGFADGRGELDVVVETLHQYDGRSIPRDL